MERREILFGLYGRINDTIRGNGVFSNKNDPYCLQTLLC